MTMPPRSSRPTLYEYAGGDDALHRLEQTFYDSVLADRQTIGFTAGFPLLAAARTGRCR